MKFAIKAMWQYPPYLRHVVTLPWEIKHSNFLQIWKNCAAHMKRAKLLLQKFPQSATDFVFFTDEKVFSVASPDNRQNDRVCALCDTRKRSIAAERLLRCCPTFSKSLMVSVAVSTLGCSPLFFVELGVKVDGRYYWDLLLKHAVSHAPYCWWHVRVPAG